MTNIKIGNKAYHFKKLKLWMRYCVLCIFISKMRLGKLINMQLKMNRLCACMHVVFRKLVTPLVLI